MLYQAVAIEFIISNCFEIWSIRLNVHSSWEEAIRKNIYDVFLSTFFKACTTTEVDERDEQCRQRGYIAQANNFGGSST